MAWYEKFDALMAEKASDVRMEKDAIMAKYTSFHIGGAAKRMAFPKTEEEVALVYEVCVAVSAKMLVIGKGTNLLVADEGLDCVVINMIDMNEIRVEGNCVYAQAGASLFRVAVAAQQQGLSGLVFAHGIPGSLGGAIAMNAGAYGGEMQQVIRSVTALFPDGICTLAAEELQFGYRHSIFSDEEGIVLSAVMELKPGDADAIRAEMDDLMQRRKTSQPLEYASAGSTFKRPTGYFAGTLIEQSGLKGTAVGDAEVSVKHAGFIINKGNASCADVLKLIGIVQDTVYEKFGVHLETEVKLIR